MIEKFKKSLETHQEYCLKLELNWTKIVLGSPRYVLMIYEEEEKHNFAKRKKENFVPK